MVTFLNRSVFTTMLGFSGLLLLSAAGASQAQETIPPSPQPVQQTDNPGPEPEPEAAHWEDVLVDEEGRIEMHIHNGPLDAVLQQLLHKLRININYNNVQGKVSVDLYDATLEQALDAILRPNGYGYRIDDNFINIMTLEELSVLEANERRMITKAFRLNYISATDAQAILSTFLSENGVIVVSPPSATGTTPGDEGQSLAIEDLIIIRDYEANIAQLEQNLPVIDKRPKQVLVEATILRATLNESNALGVDFNVVGGVDFELLAANNGVSLQNSVNSSAIQSSISGQGSSSGGASVGSDFGRLTNTVPPSKLNDETVGISTEFAANVPNGGLRFGIVTDHVSMFIRALEAVSDVTVLANPKVLALNKHAANVLVGSRDGYISTTETTQTSTVSAVEFLETGTQLQFRPWISDDGSVVRMEITPSDSTGGVDARGLPFERTTEVTTNIIVEDGHTVLIAGLFRDTATSGRSQIPLLGNLPIVGSAFGSKSDSTIREEVIILLTVHVVEDQSEYAEYSANLLDDMERIRVGVRNNMQITGRERLAQAHYHAALEYVTEGKDDLALWHAKLAIHNRPSFLEAITLKEDLMQERSWDAEGSVTRDFIHDLILKKKGLPIPGYN